MRYLSKYPEYIEEILSEKGFNLIIDTEGYEKYNRYYLQRI